MSVAKLAVTTLPPFTNSLSRVHLFQPLREPGMLAKRYEALSRLSQSLVSQKPEDLPCNVSALMRPVLDFDFLDVIVFKEGSSEVLWHSIGAGQLPASDVPMEETTFWWVHERQQPLCIADWKRDDRFTVRREALKKLGFEYRSLCRLPLRGPHGPLGVLSVASLRPHNYSEEEKRFLFLAADQVALALSSALHFERSRRTQSELDVKCAQLGLLQDLTNGVANLELEDLLRVVTAGARRVIPSDLAVVGLLNPESGRFRVNSFALSDDSMLDGEAVESL